FNCVENLAIFLLIFIPSLLLFNFTLLRIKLYKKLFDFLGVVYESSLFKSLLFFHFEVCMEKAMNLVCDFLFYFFLKKVMRETNQ
ncbi:MAG: hypothetical protein L3J10_09810, partial [Sulfurimonas sp.]|nr:hypothetical protein [Sulfurimonas sp.]